METPDIVSSPLPVVPSEKIHVLQWTADNGHSCNWAKRKKHSVLGGEFLLPYRFGGDNYD